MSDIRQQGKRDAGVFIKRARSVTTTLVTTALALLVATPACTLFVDRSAAQCHTDDDCMSFGFHPYCQHSSNDPANTPNTACKGERDCVCVPSTLQPRNCFFGPPATTDIDPKHFLNRCTPGALPSDETAGECLTYRGATTDAGTKDPPPTPPASPSDAGIPVPVPCKSVGPAGGLVLYMSGSSNFPSLLAKLGPAISKTLERLGQQPITPVFKTTTSCLGVQSIYPDQTKPSTTPPTYYAAHTIRDLTGPADSYPQYFDTATGKLASCSLGPTGATVDIGESEIFADTCPNMTSNILDVADTQGPKLAMLFVVPLPSDQKVINSATARAVFGGGGLDPWTEYHLFFIRGAGTATAQLIGRSIGVPSNRFWGIDQGTAEALALNLKNTTDAPVARKAIGILGADVYDKNRNDLKALAFQATDQDCAYTPDSNSNSPVLPRDKINVRDGHYQIWGPVHLFNVRLDGVPLPPAVNNFVSLFGPRPSPEMLDAFIDASVVPECAMMVHRETELGPLVSAVPPVSCGCHFDALVNPSPGFLPPGCKKCSSNSECTDQKTKIECIYGFCDFPSQ